VGGFDAGSIGLMLPVLRESSGADAAGASLLVSLYIAGTLVALPLAGWLAARIGTARIYAACAAIAAAGAAVALGTDDIRLLYGARLLQGIGQSPLLPLAATIVALQWAPERQGRWIGAISLSYGLAFSAAMVVTPLLMRITPHAPFAVSLALAVIACVPTSAASPAPAGSRARWLTRPVAALLAIAAGTGLGQAAIVYLPTLAILRLGVAKTDTGVLMLPLVTCGIAATLGITLWMDRTGPRVLLALGAIGTLAGIAIAGWGPASKIAFMAGTALLGLGITGLCGGPLRFAATRVVPRESQATAQAAIALVTNVGVLAGSLLIGAIDEVVTDERAALQEALLVACVAMAVTFAPLLARGRPAPQPARP
jgi:MFS family permease